MSRGAQNYVLDTNLIIEGLRNREAQAKLVQFHNLFAPFEYLSAIVVQELKAGARSKKDLQTIEKHILEPFVRRGRLIAPSFGAWERSGEALCALALEEGLELPSVSKSFGNDLLLALSCREAGITLVTQNVRDFTRIRRIVPFRFVAPWPAPMV
jgi:predicted nucleic acid-binding protein